MVIQFPCRPCLKYNFDRMPINTVQFYVLLFVLFCCLTCGVRDELMETVCMADISKVTELTKLDPTILSSRPPVLVNRVERQYGRTAIMVCGLDPQRDSRTEVDADCAQIVKLLVRMGANVSHTDINGWNAISMYAASGFFKTIQFLVSHGASVDVPDKNGMTAIMKAAAHGHLHVFRALFEAAGCMSLRTRDNTGITALHHAVNLAVGNTSYETFLLNALTVVSSSSCPVDLVTDGDGRTILMHAAISGNIAIARMLLNTFDCNPALEDRFGRSVLALTEMWNGADHVKAPLRAMILDSLVSRTERTHTEWLVQTASGDPSQDRDWDAQDS